MNESMLSNESKPISPLQPKARRRKPGMHWIPLLLIGIVTLVVAYFVGAYVLMMQVDSRYWAGDCAKLVSYGKTIEALYPPSIVPGIESTWARYQECRLFTGAAAAQEQGDWQNAYAGYEAYLAEYPYGVVKSQAAENAAATLLSWAGELENGQEFEQAAEKLTLLSEKYPTSSAAGQAAESMAGVLLAWAGQLAGSGEYEAAIQKLNRILEDYPDTAGAEPARESLAQAYLNWATQLQENGETQAAIEKLAVILESYANTSVADQAVESMGLYLTGWLQDMEASQEYKAEVEQTETILKAYADHPALKPAREAMAHLYVSWAGQLMEQQKCSSAASKLTVVVEEYADTAVYPEARESMAQALLCWANLEIDTLSQKLPVFSRRDKTTADQLSASADVVKYWYGGRGRGSQWVIYYSPAATKLAEIVEEYSDTAVITEARETYAWYLYTWAAIHKTNQSYGDALGLLNIIIEDIGENSYIGKAEAMKRSIQAMQ